MRYCTIALTLIVGFVIGNLSGIFSLEAGNVVFKNLKDSHGVTTADVFVIGERQLFRRSQTMIYKDWPLYDSKGNRLIRILQDNR